MHLSEEGDGADRLRLALFDAGLLLPTGVRGVYGRAGAFEDVVVAFDRLVDRLNKPLRTDVLRFPPMFPRAEYTCMSHVHNFPDLMGSVHSFTGGEREHRELVRKLQDGEDWTTELSPTEVMLLPATCYPLYPTARGDLPAGGRMVDLQSWVFRHEPSDDPTRLQAFRMHELVCLGTPEQALAHRDHWIEAGLELLRSLDLPVEAVVANDPFFGRGGRLSKATQREQALKYELVVPVTSAGKPTAVASSNLHLDAFSKTFEIRTDGGEPAHTSCVGFGLERVAMALFATHGLRPAAWPTAVRTRLDLD
ncbi:MAG: amino acid--[acyl-carrier-protein] ligase [Alphaproteobacteria bacterium]|nr:amino acid--[acyl-carrier-protein] ligase [Alphaproteobacteria bacterium]